VLKNICIVASVSLFLGPDFKKPMSQPSTFRSLSQSTPPALLRLIQRAQQLQQTTRTVRNQLPDALATHCHPGNVDNDTLFIHVNSPAWATRLRYFSPELLKRLKKQPATRNIRHIRIGIEPAPPPRRRSTERPRHRLSPESAALLLQSASTASTPRLRNALERLAHHADSRQANPPP